MSSLPGKAEQMVSVAVAALAMGVMPVPLSRDSDRDGALDRLAAVAGQRGWGMDVLRDVAGPQADLLFPGGETEILEAWSDLCDRRMLEAMQETEEPRLSRRVRQAILYRLPADDTRRAAAAKAMAIALTPRGQAAFRRAWLRTVNALWQAARDDSTGVTYLTKRLSLGHIYAMVFLYWLSRGSDGAAMAAFVDRRLAGVARLGRLKARMTGGQGASPARAAE
ncbi:rpsU-divergently transcribed protein [Acetobacter sp. TBRC 12305]|uniref:RpsU-divergently transcribed protein n=1 Tax=Acetobacter garciniae TaxID=2817435 RepID=A0A939KRQ9_9PROT|nr:rpsU-divergently transcribed protein [Acetobacter garciniae]MBO1325916.1 rpsU-divergently transcribed protein [Acetobacter garciniae]MBX0345816.1 rpsU-divergently transcribed protein [Acetobacter garciniae]